MQLILRLLRRRRLSWWSIWLTFLQFFADVLEHGVVALRSLRRLLVLLSWGWQPLRRLPSRRAPLLRLQFRKLRRVVAAAEIGICVQTLRNARVMVKNVPHASTVHRMRFHFKSYVRAECI